MPDVSIAPGGASGLLSVFESATFLGDWDAAPPIPCPVCGDDYVHLQRVEVDQLGNVVEIAGDGPGFLQRGNRGGRRGTTIRVDCWGECGHAFALVVRFHKGQSFLTVEPLPDHDSGEWPPELARD